MKKFEVDNFRRFRGSEQGHEIFLPRIFFFFLLFITDAGRARLEALSTAKFLSVKKQQQNLAKTRNIYPSKICDY